MALPPVVGFIDMDCFYVAVERARDPRLRGIPCAVVQYSANERGMPDLPADADRRRDGGAMGGIIAVSYEARARGVTRQMMGPQARKACPEIVLVQVPTAFGKADLKIYKAAGDDVVALLAKRADATEKRSVDEVAIDITSEAERLLRERDWVSDLVPAAQRAAHLADSVLSRKAATVSRDDTRKGHEGQQVENATFESSTGCWQEIAAAGATDVVMQRLVAGAVVVAELRAEVKAKLGFTCSGGVATNKILAKLGCGLHKPDQETLLLPRAVPLLLHDLPLERLPGLGGDLGNLVKSTLAVETAGQLVEKQGEAMIRFPEKAEWLVALASGKDSAADPVKDRQLVKSLSNGKTFFGSSRLRSAQEAEHWLREMACELHQRYREQVEQYQRSPTTIGIHVGVGDGRKKGMQGAGQSSSRQQAIELGKCGTLEQIVASAKACFQRWHNSSGLQPNSQLGITSLGISLTNMVQLDSHSGSLSKLFAKGQATATQGAASLGSHAASVSHLAAETSIGKNAQAVAAQGAPPLGSRAASVSRVAVETSTGKSANIMLALLAGKSVGPAKAQPDAAGTQPSSKRSQNEVLLKTQPDSAETQPKRSPQNIESTQQRIVASPPRKRACIRTLLAKAAAPLATSIASTTAELVADVPSRTASGASTGVDVGEVDEKTLAELPLAIQLEIRQHLRTAGASQGSSKQVVGFTPAQKIQGQVAIVEINDSQ